jgi:polyisoprenoid-binding protein YceI
MTRRTKLTIAAVAAVLVGLAGGAAWWFLTDDPPEELSVRDVVDATPDDDGDSGGDGAGALDGTWSVAPSSETQAGLRITESFVGGLADHTAVGRTTGVTGSVEIEGRTLTAADFTVDLTGLEWSDRPGFPTTNRSLALKDQALETDTYPEATFTLTEPASADALPTGGEPVPIEISGDLTLHGVTRTTTFTVDVAQDADRLVVGTAEPVTVVLADHEIDEPRTPSLAGVAGEGSFEFVVVLTAAG